MNRFITATLVLVLTACATTPSLPRFTEKAKRDKPTTFVGVCQHPGIAHGKAFPLPSDAKIDGSLITVYFEDGSSVGIYGANCVLHEEKP